MSRRTSSVSRWTTAGLSLVIVVGFYLLSQPPGVTEAEASALAARFRFNSTELPEISGMPFKTVRAVHPSVRHISGMISFVGAAVALGDLDGDGLSNDIVLVDPRTDQVTVMPAPGSGNRYQPFLLDASPLPVDLGTSAPSGSLIGDFNEDGLADILVYFLGRSPILYLRRDDAPGLSRTHFAATELVSPPEHWHTGAVVQADFDGDGHLDLAVGNYFPDDSHILDPNGTGWEVMPDSLNRSSNGGRKRLLLWQSGIAGANPRAVFRVAPDSLPPEIIGQWTFGFAAADLDGDLLPELYCVHDWSQDRLLHNRSTPGKPAFGILEGERTFTTPRSKVLGRDTFNGMGADIGDLNGDGWPDLFVSNITANWGFHESSFLFLSTGQVARMRDGIAPYHDESEKFGVARGGWTWEARMGDFDNDGSLELMQATGFQRGKVNGWARAQEFVLGNDQNYKYPFAWGGMGEHDDICSNDRNPFFVRTASGRYHDIAEKLGIPAGMISRGIATGDLDGDGRLDFVVANNFGPSFVFRNSAKDAGAFLGLHLRTPLGQAPGETQVQPGHPTRAVRSRPAIGAHATVHLSDGRALVGEVDGGSGHSGKKAAELHFGLGKSDPAKPVRVDLRWRGTDGKIRSQSIDFKPGWHTVILGDATVPEGAKQ